MALTFGLEVKFEMIFHWNKFCHYFVKNIKGEFDQTLSKSFIDRWHMTIIIFDLQLTYICMYCVGLRHHIQ